MIIQYYDAVFDDDDEIDYEGTFDVSNYIGGYADKYNEAIPFIQAIKSDINRGVKDYKIITNNKIYFVYDIIYSIPDTPESDWCAKFIVVPFFY